MYGICRSLQEVLSVFSNMLEHDNFSWNFAIKAYSSHGECVMALQLAKNMEIQGCLIDKYIFASILSAVKHRSDVGLGLFLHSCFYRTEICEDSAVCTALITMYGNCDLLELARDVFDSMRNHDNITWTAMIAALSQCGYGKYVFCLFNCMMHRGLIPDVVSFVSILDAFAGGISSHLQCKIVHFYVLSCGFDMNVVIGTALVNMYGKSSCLLNAQRVFHGMIERNVVTWNALIGLISRNGGSQDALQILDQMAQEGVLPNKVTFVNGLDACNCSLAIGAGKRIHASIELERAFGGSIVVETALVNMYGQCGELACACEIFEKMLDHDEIALISILSACASCRALAEGKHLHSYAIYVGFEGHVVLVTALINMYSKCGSLNDAQRVFDRMPERNLISWNAIIAAYCQNGMGKQSLLLYEQMHLDNTRPDDVTFLSVLSACSHAGLLEEGLQIFNSMKCDYHITPNVDQYNCMIDLFGRTGRLKEAEDLILNMPIEPSVASWTTLLGACRKEVDVDRGERAAFWLFAIDPEDIVPYVMLANLYAAAGRGDDAEHVMAMMREKGLKMQLGKSLIQINDDNTKFSVNVQAHTQMEETYAQKNVA